jgi:flagellar biosynthesis/type III secretory pathway chaperone
MGPAKEFEAAIEDLLNNEREQLRSFVALLERELDALAIDNTEDIRMCAAEKLTVLGKIFASRDAVNSIVARAAGTPAPKSPEAWLAYHPSARLRDAFARLTSGAAEARQLNQLTSRLVQHKLRSINRRLETLSPGHRFSPIYQPEGSSKASIMPSGVIGRA